MAKAKAKRQVGTLIGIGAGLGLGVALTLFFRSVGLEFYEYLPLHYAALIAGAVFGPFAGSVTGLVVPFLTWLVFRLPGFDPAIGIMALELGTYGLIAGVTYVRARWHLHPSLLLAMLSGRAVFGALNWFLLGLENSTYTVNSFVYTAFRRPVAGIALILVFVPLTVLALERTPLSRR